MMNTVFHFMYNPHKVLTRYRTEIILKMNDFLLLQNVITVKKKHPSF